MRAADLRKPRNDKLKRQAEEAAKRMEEAYARYEPHRRAIQEAFEWIERGTRRYFEVQHLNASMLIDLQDAMRIAFAQLEEERGILPHDPADPEWGRAGRDPMSSQEMLAVKAYVEDDAPRPFFWFGKGERSE